MTSTVAEGSRRILVDTSAFYSLFNTRDTEHSLATGIITRLVVARYQLFTTNFLVAETHALILTRRGHELAHRFLNTLIMGGYSTIVRVSEVDEERALAIINQYDDK